MDTQRLILLFIFGFSILMLWEAWEKENRPKPAPQAERSVPAAGAKQGAAPAPAPAASGPAVAAQPKVPTAAPAAKGETITVRTDLMIAEIDTLGATLKRVELLKHKDSEDESKDYVLLGPAHHYEAQSGLAGEGGPNHTTLWNAQPGERTLQAGQNALEVRLEAKGKDGVAVTKIYRFKRDSYLIDVEFDIANGGAAPLQPATYFQLKH